jgi:hypothetical protein
MLNGNPSILNHSAWSVDDVCQWLRLVWTNEFEQLFRHMNVDGKVLMQLDDRQSVEDMLHLSEDQSAWVAAFVSSLKVATSARQNEVNIHSFRLVKPIGEGAFGQVWLGRRKGTDKLYAIKSLDKVRLRHSIMQCPGWILIMPSCAGRTISGAPTPYQLFCSSSRC